MWGHPMSTTIQQALFVLKLSSFEPTFPSVASNAIPPGSPQKIIFTCFFRFSCEILDQSAFQNDNWRDYQSFRETRYQWHFFSLFFLETIPWRRLGGTLDWLMIFLHQQAATQTVSSWLCTAVWNPETKITASKNLLTARYFPFV